jgi:TatD DNase family protein
LKKVPFIDVHTHNYIDHNLSVFQFKEEKRAAYYSYGIHPWDADKPFFFDDLSMLLNSPNCLAIGEIGLDKNKGPSLIIQIEMLEKQIEMAEQLKLPVIIHCVKAWNELRHIKRRLNPKQSWIFHGFSKTTILEDVLSEGLFVSFGEAILRNPKLMEASTNVPLENLFFETDDSNVSIETIYLEFTKKKQITLQQLKELQYNNFKSVFKKWKSG